MDIISFNDEHFMFCSFDVFESEYCNAMREGRVCVASRRRLLRSLRLCARAAGLLRPSLSSEERERERERERETERERERAAEAVFRLFLGVGGGSKAPGQVYISRVRWTIHHLSIKEDQYTEGRPWVFHS